MFDENLSDDELAKLVSERRSRDGMVSLAEWVGDDAERFAKVWHLVQHGEGKQSEHTSWLMFHCLEKHPHLLEPHQFDAYQVLLGNYHGAVMRAVIKGLTHTELSEDLSPLLFDLSISYITDRNAEVAVRCHSIFLGWHIAEGIFEYENELYDAIHVTLPSGSAGFRNRGKKVLKWIEKSQANV